MTLNWRDKIKLALTGLLIKLGKIKFDDFTIDELQAVAAPYFPLHYSFDVPAGSGHLRITEARIQCQADKNRLAIQCYSDIDIAVLDTRLYRAHLILVISAIPRYDAAKATLHAEDIQVDVIQLVNDSYALLNDTQTLIEQVLPGIRLGKSLTDFITKPLLNVASIATTGKTDRLLAYLRLYLSHNKQRILDYHKPQIASALLHHLDNNDVGYALQHSWRDECFRRWGKSVYVEENTLRFSFT